MRSAKGENDSIQNSMQVITRLPDNTEIEAQSRKVKVQKCLKQMYLRSSCLCLHMYSAGFLLNYLWVTMADEQVVRDLGMWSRWCGTHRAKSSVTKINISRQDSPIGTRPNAFPRTETWGSRWLNPPAWINKTRSTSKRNKKKGEKKKYLLTRKKTEINASCKMWEPLLKVHFSESHVLRMHTITLVYTAVILEITLSIISLPYHDLQSAIFSPNISSRRCITCMVEPPLPTLALGGSATTTYLKDVTQYININSRVNTMQVETSKRQGNHQAFPTAKAVFAVWWIPFLTWPQGNIALGICVTWAAHSKHHSIA